MSDAQASTEAAPGEKRDRKEIEPTSSNDHKASTQSTANDTKTENGNGDPPRRRRKKQRGWDVGPSPANAPASTSTPIPAQSSIPAQNAPAPRSSAVDAAATAAALLKEQIAKAQLGVSNPADNPKQRELYVGNLQRGISGDMVHTFFNTHHVLQQYHKDGPPCVRVQLDSGGTFAFVEFRTPEIATKALGVNGENLVGRPIRTGRPRGYIDPNSGAVNDVAAASKNDPNKKAREIYVGNITVGVTSDMLASLFDSALGPNVVAGCTMNDSGKYCFIEFKTPEIATRALQLNGMDLVGRPLKVGRPAGYNPGGGGVLGGLGPSMGLTGTMGLGLGGIGAGAGLLGAATGLGGFGGLAMRNPLMMAAGLQMQQAAAAAALSGGLGGMMNINPAITSGITGINTTVATTTSSTVAPPPSQNIVLENMITEKMLQDEREYKECLEDIKIECEGFGEVANVTISKDGIDRGKVFVSFKTTKAAEAALKDLNGRVFDGNTVKASQYQRRYLQILTT
eukprot:jgi/Bigna1/77071/fgenesh1_pg.45_\